MAFFIKHYLNALKYHPLKTHALTTGILMMTGDAISQNFFEKSEAFNIKRSFRFFTFGTCILGPSLRYWYLFLEKKFVSTSAIGLFSKIASDQLIFSPAVLFIFLTTMTYSTTTNWQLVQDKLKKDYFVILFNGYKLWPAVQVITFYVIPFSHRILFVNSVALFWNSYLAYKSSN